MVKTLPGWTILLCLVSTSVSLGSDQPFIPIPEMEKPLYKFNFNKWFYADETARQKDLAELKELTAQIRDLKPEVSVKAKKLLAAVELKQRMGIIADRVQAYGGLRLAVNTQDPVAKREAQEGEDARDNFDADTAFIENTVQAFDDNTLKTFMTEEPGLARYEFLLRTWRRKRPHTAPEPVEVALNKLSSRLDPFRSPFYTLMRGRSPDAVLEVGARSLNVTNAEAYAEILRLDDRKLREVGFRKRMATYKAQGDLYAFALYEKARGANAVADIRDFPNALDAALFEYFLTPETVDTVLKGFRDHAGLAIRFQKAERAYQAKLLGLGSAEPWDLDARPLDAPEPRFVIGEASRAVRGAMRVFGTDYEAELDHLIDPQNGRLDIVAGANRKAGDFTWGAYGSSWFFYMHGYNGYLTDVVTFAHELAHPAHFRLLYKAGVPWYYGDGARYFTEGFAKVNELLILDHLSKTAKTKADKLFYLRQFNSKLASVKFAAMYWAAYATSFEVEVYRRLKSGQVQKPEDIHEIWAEFGRLWMQDFDRFPDLKYTWADTHHFFNSPRYYSNYLFAWVFALAVYERVQADPGTAKKFVDLMKAGFSNEPAVLLRTHLGVDLSDPQVLERMFTVVEKGLAEFEGQVLDNKN